MAAAAILFGTWALVVAATIPLASFIGKAIKRGMGE